MSAVSDARWDAFVHKHPRATFFHLAGWRRIATTVFGHKAHYLSAERDGELVALLPLVEVRSRLFGHALISNAFCVGGGPLATDALSMANVVQQAEALGRQLKVDYVELRDAPDAQPGWLTREDLYAGFEREMAAAEDERLSQIPRKQRAVVRKALERGLTVSVSTDASEFYSLYARTMRDHGTPALPRRFFDVLLAAFPGYCDVLTVRRNGQPLSSVLSYYFRDRVLPYYTGSRLEARHLGANDLMYWALMGHAVQRDCTVFDFGRSKVGTGPYSFKRNWGFEPRPISHQYRMLTSDSLPNINPTNPKYARFIEAWRRLPVPLATAVSPLLSRSLA